MKILLLALALAAPAVDQAAVDRLVAVAGGLAGIYHEKQTAAQARASLQRLPPATAPLFFKHLASIAPHEHQIAYRTVLDMGPRATPYLAPALDSPDWRTRWGAIMVISATRGPASRPLLERALGDAAPEVRAQAALGCAFQLDPWGVPLLCRVLADAREDERVRLAAARGLRFVAYKRRDIALPAGTTARLCALLDDPHRGVREAARTALEEIGPAALPALAARLDARECPNAALAFGVIAGENPRVRGETAARFDALLAHPDWRLRAAAAESLGAWGPAGRQRARACASVEGNPAVRQTLMQVMSTRRTPRPDGL